MEIGNEVRGAVNRGKVCFIRYSNRSVWSVKGEVRIKGKCERPRREPKVRGDG